MTEKGDRKWKCEYCTFENWPATKRCTVCRALKPPEYIHDEAPIQEQDIYKMAPLICSSGQGTSSPSGSLTPTTSQSSPTSEAALTSKWPCQACTYLNWPKANKCTQCLTPRPKAVPILTRDLNQPLSVNVHQVQGASANIDSRNNSPRNSPKISPTSPEEAKALNNDRNRAIVASSSNLTISKNVKWCCKACTYENWPKATKCVLCGVPKGKVYTENTVAASDPISSGSSSISPRTSASSKKSKRRSPPLSRQSSGRSGSSEDMYTGSGGGATASISQHPGDTVTEKKDRNKSSDNRASAVRTVRTRVRDSEWLWLNACKGVVQGDVHAVEAFLASGGDVSRQLSADECRILNRPSAFEVGYTLVHLAIRFQREDLLTALLTAADVVKKAKKRMPCHVAPDIASEILRNVSASIRQRKGDFPCYFLTELATFALPADIEDFPVAVKKQMFAEILDQGVQKELEDEEPVINWSMELTERLNSRLYALWNRTAGDCLLDSVLQASFGIFDRDNTLRRALADSLVDGAVMFYPRWKECEVQQAESMHFSLDESQWQQDWHILLNLASQPGSSLEQVHIFALAHILRRPVIVYGIKFVKSFRGENLGFARFQGVYLPLLWEQSFCFKTPISLGYTRGHFSALVPMEVDMLGCMGAGANLDTTEDEQIAYLPLTDCEGKLLPIHFLPPGEVGKEETILREWLDICVTDGGLLVAQQKIPKRPLLVKQMMDEWLERYRRLSDMVQTKAQKQQQQQQRQRTAQHASSDEETDDE